MFFAIEFMDGFLEFIVSFFCYALFFLVPVGIFAAVVHILFSIPFRRRERARFFLDLLETSLNQNNSVEQMILSAAQSRDRALGVRFYIVAAYVEGGLKLGEALKKVPQFLPPQISAMLRTGEKLGNLKSVLPACREILRNPAAAVTSAAHYMVALLLVFSPVAVWLTWALSIWVFPQFKAVVYGMDVQLWPVTRFVFEMTPAIVGLESGLFLLLIIAAVVYVGGPRFTRWFQFRAVPIVDWIAWRVPWKQKRLQRTFSAMLAVLLDGGVPEAEAVRLAGACTANAICVHRAERVVAAMEQGVKLDDAVQLFDKTGEFHWRLTNAVHSRGGFLHALKGWHESLDAKAFQQQEATAHVVTSGLVILNGLVVGLIAVAMFGILISILNGEIAW